MIEPKRDTEIHLLRRAQTIQPARIQEQAGARILGIIANVFHKQARFLGYFFFD